VLAHSDVVDELLAKAESLTRAQWRIAHERFDRLRPAEWRKLNDVLFDEGGTANPYKGLSEAAERRLDDELDGQINRVSEIVERLPSKVAGDTEFRIKMEVALGRLVYVTAKREYIRTPKGKRAAAVVDGLFDGLLATAPDEQSEEQDRTTGLYTLHGALALRRKPRSHPVSPAYGACVAIWERIESHLHTPRDERRLTHGEQLFHELFFHLDGEVQNGGLEVYLENSAGDRAEMARAYLAEIGAWATLEALDLVAELFPDGVVPTARRQRVSILEKAEAARVDFANPVGEATDLYMKAQLTLYERLMDYVAEHPEDFARPDAAEIGELAQAALE
jgi:Domain of unknown function (DUF4375)